MSTAEKLERFFTQKSLRKPRDMQAFGYFDSLCDSSTEWRNSLWMNALCKRPPNVASDLSCSQQNIGLYTRAHLFQYMHVRKNTVLSVRTSFMNFKAPLRFSFVRKEMRISFANICSVSTLFRSAWRCRAMSVKSTAERSQEIWWQIRYKRPVTSEATLTACNCDR